MNFNHGEEREKKETERERKAKILQYIHKFLVGIKNSEFYLLRMVIFLQYTEECYTSRICFANNTVVISKSNSSVKYTVFPIIMKNIHCVAIHRTGISKDMRFGRL
jgi:hypothetical protein